MSARSSSILWATGLARTERTRVAGSIVLGAVSILAAVGLLAMSGYLISKASLQPPILTLTVAIVFVRAFSIIRAVSRYLERLLSHDAALRVLSRLRVTLYERLVPLVPGGLGRTRSTDLLSRFVADVDALQHLFVRALGPPAIAALTIAAAGLTAWLLVPAAGVVLVVCLTAAAFVLPALSGRLGVKAGRRQAAARAELTGELVEALEGAPELAVYGRAEDRLARVARADDELVRLARRDARLAGATSGLGLAATGATIALVLVAAIPSIGGSDDGVLLAALALLAMAAFEAILPLPVAAQHMSATASAAERLRDVTERPVPVPEPSPSSPLPPTGALVVEDLTVLHPGATEAAVAQATFRVRPGERVAVVGSSGAGKSTLALALTRLIPVAAGRATLGGVDLAISTGDDVRTAIRLEAGDGHLFATSLRENVRLARPDATDLDVDAALARAGLGPWIATLPAGPDTHVGEDGALLSGGQRQRVLLARMLLADARILILDEPAAHLDPEGAESLVRDALASLPLDVGVLLITHRLVGLDGFDRILVMDRGRIVESGAPAELAAAGGRYAELWRRGGS